MVDDKCKCGDESTKGCHGITGGEVYSEYYCDACFVTRNEPKKVKKNGNDSSNSVQKDKHGRTPRMDNKCLPRIDELGRGDYRDKLRPGELE